MQIELINRRSRQLVGDEMALIRCAECGRTVSQYASSCPFCGVDAEPMSDAEYARAKAAAQAVRDKDSRFTLFVFGGIVGLIVLSIVFGRSREELRADEERKFREHVSTLDQQKRQRESEQFWRGVGMEKHGAGR